MPEVLLQSETLNRFPAPWPVDLLPGIQNTLEAKSRKVWILDDDPTGTQTIAGLPVITTWDVDTLRAEFDQPEIACFVLTNSRGLTAEVSNELHREFMRNLREAASDRHFTLISRSDSTLRGHYPLETDVLAEAAGGADLTLIAPYFAAGGRFTCNDTHYVAEQGQLIPAGDTPFARDAVFGYRNSHLPSWIEEKTNGAIKADDVICLPLETIRNHGPNAIARILIQIPIGSVVVVNAIEQSDIEVVTTAVLAVEAVGYTVVARTAASYVCARVGQRPPPLLTGEQISDDQGQGGLTIIGSHVPKTTAQLNQLKLRHDVDCIELNVSDLLDGKTRDAAVAAAIAATNSALARDRDTVVHTSRELIRSSDDTANLSISSEVSRALIEVVQNLAQRPRYLIAKGGITSSDTATEGLGVKRAIVQGQILPGVPVWALGPETKFPGLSYVIFPGNVGDDNAVAEAISKFNSASL